MTTQTIIPAKSYIPPTGSAEGLNPVQKKELGNADVIILRADQADNYGRIISLLEPFYKVGLTTAILMLIASPSLHADNWLKSRVIQEIVEAAESQIDEQIQSDDEDETVEQHEPAIADSSIEEQKVEADAVTPAPSDHSTSTSSDWDAIVAEERRKQAEQDARDEAEWKRQQEKRRQEYDEMRQRTAEDKARKEAERKRRADEQRRKDAEMFARSREQERLEKEQRQREEEEADRRAPALCRPRGSS